MNIVGLAVLAIAFICSFFMGYRIVIADMNTIDMLQLCFMQGLGYLGYLLGVILIANIIVTLIMLVMGLVALIKKKDVKKWVIAELFVFLFASAMLMSFTGGGYTLSLGCIFGIVFLLAYFVANAIIDILFAKKENKPFVATILSKVTSFVLCFAILGTGFPVYKADGINVGAGLLTVEVNFSNPSVSTIFLTFFFLLIVAAFFMGSGIRRENGNKDNVFKYACSCVVLEIAAMIFTAVPSKFKVFPVAAGIIVAIIFTIATLVLSYLTRHFARQNK